MKKIICSDMTLVQKAKGLSFKEKIEIARHLDNLCVDVIHMPAIENVKTDSLMIRTICAFIKNSTVCVETGAAAESVTVAAAAVQKARRARLMVRLPVSAVQMEYTYHKKAPKMLELAKTLFAAATSACDDVEFFAEDATRADSAFLGDMINAASDAGIKTVTLCDDEGVMLPDEFSAFLANIKTTIPALSSMNIGILCRDTHGMATASAVMAIKAGASEIKCAVGNADIPDLDTFGGIVNYCGDRQGIYSDMNYNELHRIEKQIRWILGATDTAAPAETKAEIAEDTTYSKADSKETIAAAIAKLGYDLAEADVDRVYEEFCHVAEKKSITAKDLDAVVANVALQVPPTYTLESYVINNGNVIGASAQIKLMKNGEPLSGIAMGDGPVDASFRTLEQIIGRHFELDEFRIEAVTEGREALGKALVKLRNNGKLYSGNGLSSDVIGASIRAYVNAVNKIVYEENV
ncbi:MAG: hypothetical protein J6K14_01340 [Clostridia bacterium]|nr:hypothetical protein [Clostridia bacterium]